MTKALETLHALRLMAELRNDRVSASQIKRDIKAIELDIIQFKSGVQ
jgi:predicted DNA-binding transcriptional regulator YafY